MTYDTATATTRALQAENLRQTIARNRNDAASYLQMVCALRSAVTAAAPNGDQLARWSEEIARLENSVNHHTGWADKFERDLDAHNAETDRLVAEARELVR